MIRPPRMARVATAGGSRSLARRVRALGCLGLAVRGNTAPQCLHEIDGPARHRPARFRLRRHPGLLGLEVRDQRLLIAVTECGGIESRELAVENMFGKTKQFRCGCQLWDPSAKQCLGSRISD